MPATVLPTTCPQYTTSTPKLTGQECMRVNRGDKMSLPRVLVPRYRVLVLGCRVMACGRRDDVSLLPVSHFTRHSAITVQLATRITSQTAGGSRIFTPFYQTLTGYLARWKSCSFCFPFVRSLMERLTHCSSVSVQLASKN